MHPECKQCGRPIEGMIETVFYLGFTYHFHQGGCPSGYPPVEPTRQTPR